MDRYVKWLLDVRHAPLLQEGGTWWRVYQKSVLQASLKPQAVSLSADEAARLLKDSGALLVRYFTRTFDAPTEFWYTSCEQYQFDALSRKARNQIRRAYKTCQVKQIDASWLAANGYECYSAAFARYRKARPQSLASFRRNLLGDQAGPFDFWGVFADEKLIAYAKCAVGDDYVAIVVAKFHPEHLHFYPAYALLDTILKLYVQDRGKPVSNGFRSVAHDTNMQEFLEKFGFHKVYCDLCVVYRPLIGLVVKALYPLQPIVERVRSVPALGALLTQERIQRTFS